MTIGVSIKHLRTVKGLKQQEVSKAVGITQSYLSLIESGKKTPTIKTLQSFADYFQAPLPILFWFTIEESDVKEEKVEAFRALKPTIDDMLDSLFK